MRSASLLLAFLFLTTNPLMMSADWPMVRGSATHTGYVPTALPRNLQLRWAVEFDGERIGAAVEPVVANGKVLAGTHAGVIHALDAVTGEQSWWVETGGAVLQSPACADGKLIVANSAGDVLAFNIENGSPLWSHRLVPAGFSAAPIVTGNRIVIGSRSGDLVCLDGSGGKLLWKQRLPAPIRQTAACDDDAIFIAAEDLRLRAFSLESGRALWATDPMYGQTARDYYPTIIKHGGRRFVSVRTNPLLTMSQRIGRDRTMLAQNAGFDDGGWQKVDAWIKREDSRGNPELWAREQEAISQYLRDQPDAQTMYLFDAETGHRAGVAPILWIGGCQSVGGPPAQTGAGRLLVFYRSAYGNWNHGVAPLVALGLLDPGSGAITPLFHGQGRQPPWNCFWGTADESQNFVVAGNTVLLVHQGTLSGFDLEKKELFKIHGERDTYGGFRSPDWARNEWHGPGRAGVAVDGERIYWQTGSRILCLAPGERSNVQVATLHAGKTKARSRDAVSKSGAAAELARATEEWLSDEWSPLFVDPGLSGREFFFQHSGEAFEAMAFAYPHLGEGLKARVRARMRQDLLKCPPFLPSGAIPLNEGRAREWFQLPAEYRTRTGGVNEPHPFGGCWQLWAWLKAAGDEQEATELWPSILESYRSFTRMNWRLDPAKGDLHANRYIASLRAFAGIAKRAGKKEEAQEATAAAEKAMAALVAWWKRAAELTPGSFDGSRELDPFINRGDALSFKVTPHRHKIALFHDLSPEIFADVKAAAPDAVRSVWEMFSRFYRTWYLQGEERQVHFGENFVDGPDLAFNAFKILAWMDEASQDDLLRLVDIPFCRADLYYIEKLSLALRAVPDRP